MNVINAPRLYKNTAHGKAKNSEGVAEATPIPVTVGNLTAYFKA